MFPGQKTGCRAVVPDPVHGGKKSGGRWRGEPARDKAEFRRLGEHLVFWKETARGWGSWRLRSPDRIAPRTGKQRNKSRPLITHSEAPSPSELEAGFQPTSPSNLRPRPTLAIKLQLSLRLRLSAHYFHMRSFRSKAVSKWWSMQSCALTGLLNSVGSCDLSVHMVDIWDP